jgi:hypothetical protein
VHTLDVTHVGSHDDVIDGLRIKSRSTGRKAHSVQFLYTQPAATTDVVRLFHLKGSTMIKINAGFSRKVGEANYGSRGASVNVELELESNLIGDPNALSARIRGLFDIARQTVDQELGGAASNGQTPANGHTSNGNNQAPAKNDQPIRYATASQVRAIRSICQRQQLNHDRLANERFRVNAVEDLTLQQASALIDELKTPVGGRNGGGR